jgi:hypothetical protein
MLMLSNTPLANVKLNLIAIKYCIQSKKILILFLQSVHQQRLSEN